MFCDKEKSAKEKLEDYYGTAMASGFPMAVIDLSKVSNMSENEAKEECEKLGLND